MLCFVTTLKDHPAFEFFLKNLKGETITLNMKASDTIDDMRAQVSSIEDIPKEDIRLICRIQLDDGHTLKDYNIEKGSTVHMVGKCNFCVVVLRCFGFVAMFLWSKTLFNFNRLSDFVELDPERSTRTPR